MMNSMKNQKTTISEKIEKSLKDWKLPPPSSSSSDFFEKKGRSFCCIPNKKVETVEKAISLPPGYSTVPLLSNCRKRAHSICNDALFVAIIEVALKPSKLGSNTCAIICLRDKTHSKFNDSVLAMVESSLCDGPIYFPYFPTNYISLFGSTMTSDFTLDVKIEGYESVTLMYRFHYELMKGGVVSYTPCGVNDEKGETTFFLARIAQSNRVVSNKFYWNQAAVSKGWMVDYDLSSSGAVGKANIDWRETVEAHVLKADVPGFRKEDVKVVVEAGGLLLISGERSNDEAEGRDEKDEWHCLERSNGKLLRRLRLPENANLDKMEAAMENGVLTVTVPKDEVGNNTQGQGGKLINISA